MSSEDGIEIDRSPRDDILPFGVWEFWAIGFINERSLCCLGINCVDFNELERFGKSVLQDDSFVSSA